MSKYIVVRFKVDEDKAEAVERDLTFYCGVIMQEYTNVVVEASASAEQQAEQRLQVYNIYVTDAETAYQEVREEFAQDSEGDVDLLESALDGLREDVQSHPAWLAGVDEN